MEEWKEYKLAEVCENIYSGGTPSSMNASYWNGNLPWLSSGETSQRYIYYTEKCITKEGADNSSTRYAFKGSTVIASAGQGHTRGQASMLCIDTYVNQSVLVIKPNPLIINPYFLYFNIDSRYNELRQLSDGTSTRGSLSGKILKDLKIYLPPLNEQQKIVSILKSLDDKIEVNRRINDNLEQQAQALFKSWFVDFEPFKNGEFVESELGMIPKVLKTKYISDMPHVLETGRRPKGGVGELTSGIPSVGAEHVKGMGKYDFSKTKYIPMDYAATLKTGKVMGYELLIYKDGGKPGYFIPNYSIFGEGYPFDECYLNEHVFKLDFENRGYNIFCYFYFQTDPIMTYLNAQGGKAAIPGINKQDIENILIFSPENEQVKKFGAFAEPLFAKILYTCKESRRLAEMRDTLLPKLMSGELKVNDISL